MAYLIKVTIVWTIFLVLFELLYKHNAKFTANRIYLLSSILIGLLLPIIPAPSGTSWDLGTVENFYTQKQNTPTVAEMVTLHSTTTVTIPATATDSHGPDFMLIAGIIYGGGVLLLLMKCLLELFRIKQLIRKNPIQLLHGHKVIHTGKVHSPYSFLSYTFLTDANALEPEALEYIIQHEAAHNTRKHWLDLYLMQLINIAFWFHPLVWRYRYLLRLQHEYEADAIAAVEDPYTYGRFILQQALLRDVPSITHSFHFSPIKNRIHMLTKIDRFKPGNRKYLLLLPALLACSFLMAKSGGNAGNKIQGNQMIFKGNTLTWQHSDTLSYDKAKGKAEIVPANAKVKPQVITGINNEPVYRNDYLQMQASYNNNNAAFADYLIISFHRLRQNTADSLTYLTEMSIVVDKNGKVVYYNAQYARPQNNKEPKLNWYGFFNSDEHANSLMDKIIAESPLWKPAFYDGKAVNSYVTVWIPGC